MNRRRSVVAGSFYPAACHEIEMLMQRFEQMRQNIETAITPRILVVPHAGYIYSGFTANMAYSVASQQSGIDRIIVIGPSHRVAFSGASVARHESFETPCGDLVMDHVYGAELEARFEWFGFSESLHQEHSTEVQMPFIKHYFDETPVVEIVYGQIDPEMLSQSIAYMLEDTENLIVISTDLSHFYTLEDAGVHDAICIEAIESMNIGLCKHGCEACGLLGLKGAMMAAQNLKMQSRILDYRTSADTSGDKDSVVGYVSALLGF